MSTWRDDSPSLVASTVQACLPTDNIYFVPQAPRACRNFVQLCMEGYYDDCLFHRIVKDFMVQTGDPTGTGKGGESIYGEPFKVSAPTSGPNCASPGRGALCLLQ